MHEGAQAWSEEPGDPRGAATTLLLSGLQVHIPRHCLWEIQLKYANTSADFYNCVQISTEPEVKQFNFDKVSLILHSNPRPDFLFPKLVARIYNISLFYNPLVFCVGECHWKFKPL